MTVVSICRAAVLIEAECAKVQAEKDRIRGRLAAQRQWRAKALALETTAGRMNRCPRTGGLTTLRNRI